MAPSTSIDVEFVYDRFLGADDVLTHLQRALSKLAPEWGEQALVYRSSQDRDPLDLSVEGAVRNAVLRGKGERGPTYHALVRGTAQGTNDCSVALN